MENKISPKYLMKLVSKIEETLWAEFSEQKYRNVKFYIDKWHEYDEQNDWENFHVFTKDDGNIDLPSTLHNIPTDTLLKIAIDLGVETPDFIPSIPIFRNTLKSSYETASVTFEKAFKQIEENPDIAIGLANSALESIIKKILKDECIKTELNSHETLYDLTRSLLKRFQLYPSTDMPTEIIKIGSSLLTINQNIEKLRSDKTDLHGKTDKDYIIKDPLYAYFIVNAVATIGMFLDSFYHKKFSEISVNKQDEQDDDVPF